MNLLPPIMTTPSPPPPMNQKWGGVLQLVNAFQCFWEIYIIPKWLIKVSRPCLIFFE